MTIPSFHFSNGNIVIVYVYKASFYNYKVSAYSIDISYVYIVTSMNRFIN